MLKDVTLAMAPSGLTLASSFNHGHDLSTVIVLTSLCLDVLQKRGLIRRSQPISNY